MDAAILTASFEEQKRMEAAAKVAQTTGITPDVQAVLRQRYAEREREGVGERG